MAASPDYTRIPRAGDPTVIENALGEHFTLVPSIGGQIAVDGVPDPDTRQVMTAIWYQGQIHVTNFAGGWWCKAAAYEPWRPSTAPPAPPVIASAAGVNGELDMISLHVQQAVIQLVDLHILVTSLYPTKDTS